MGVVVIRFVYPSHISDWYYSWKYLYRNIRNIQICTRLYLCCLYWRLVKDIFVHFIWEISWPEQRPAFVRPAGWSGLRSRRQTFVRRSCLCNSFFGWGVWRTRRLRSAGRLRGRLRTFHKPHHCTVHTSGAHDNSRMQLHDNSRMQLMPSNRVYWVGSFVRWERVKTGRLSRNK